MVSLCWLFAAVMAYVCTPGFGSECWNSSICSDLSSKGRILDCIHLCMSLIQTELAEPEQSAMALKINDDDDDDLLLSILLASLPSTEDKISESELDVHSDERRSYLMEHFRWGKPSGDKLPEPKVRGQNDMRRSYSMEHFRWGKPSGGKIPERKARAHRDERQTYSMEHFRWGKPTGRKRRPVKVFASSLEGGGSSEGSFPFQARRQLSSNEDVAKGDLVRVSHQSQGSSREKVSSKSHALLSPQDRKDGTYRMSHFRWGNPPASKRKGNVMKLLEENPERQLSNLFRNIIFKDVQRITG